MKIAIGFKHTDTEWWFEPSASSGVGNCCELCYNVLISSLLLHPTNVFLLVYSFELLVLTVERPPSHPFSVSILKSFKEMC